MVNPITLSEPILGKDIKLVIAGSRAKEIQTVLEERARMLGRVRSYEFKGGLDKTGARSKFTQPIYDLPEIARASDVEPYINQSIRKHREQILKEGYQITGADEEMASYVKKRLFEISILTGITTQQWLRELTTNLITYHNAFLIFRRDANKSSGKPIRMYGKELDPIAGIFVGDPTSMEVSVDKWGTPKKWRQKIDGNTDELTFDKTYPPEDVVHITVDRKTGFTFGTPYLLSVLDDIRALRKLEEVAIIVSCKEAFPLYHYKVGTEQRPAIVYEGGDNEVDQVLGSVYSLPAQGYIVTSERHEVKLISKDGSALDLTPYLSYFESRVIAGLRLSPLDLGRGGTANRGTATNINKGLQDSAKDYQMVISDHITNFVILPLLLEGAYDVTEETLVKFTFPTIDREEERASQNHGLQLYMGNALSASEYRKQYLNKQPMSEEDKNDCTLRHQTEAQKEIVRAQGAARASASAGSDLGITKVSNQISNKGQPKNQHGTKPAKSRFKANDYAQKVKEKYTVAKNSILSSLEDPAIDATMIEEIFRDFVKQSVEVSRPYVEELISDGAIKAKKEFDSLNPENDYEFEEIGTRAIDRFFVNFVTKSFWKVINPYKDQIIQLLQKDSDNHIDITKIISTLEVLDKSINFLITDQMITSERFGFIKFAKKVGSKTIELVNPDTLDSTILDISDMVYKNFIPTVENANHFLSFTKNHI